MTDSAELVSSQVEKPKTALLDRYADQPYERRMLLLHISLASVYNLLRI
jgi:hypothetical protein